jgi:putative phosphoesterase
MQRALRLHPDAEVVFFLGDGLTDVIPLLSSDPPRSWHCVRGNCDFTSVIGTVEVPKVDSITLMGKKIVYTHGDLYGVKYGFSGLERLAESTGADLVLFSHTHTPCEKFQPNEGDGVYYFNPGSAELDYFSSGSFGVINITEGGILLSHGALT